MVDDVRPFFVHEQALCETTQVGQGTRIWAFAHVLPGARIGRDCNICNSAFIENDVIIGDRVTVKIGVYICDATEIEDDVFIGSNTQFTNDRYPRSKQSLERYNRTVVRRGASIGANVTLLDGIEIGMHAMIGAGTVVTRSVPPYAKVVGNPGRVVGYMDSSDK